MKGYRKTILLVMSILYLSIPLNVNAESHTVLDKFADVIIPILGGNKKRDETNKEYLTNFTGNLARNLTANGLELFDFFATVENDILFQPNKSFWDITKETYNQFINQAWSLEGSNYYHVNVPKLAGGPNDWSNIFTVNSNSVNASLSEYNWTFTAKNYADRATINELGKHNFSHDGSINGITPRYYNISSDYSTATYAFFVGSSVNTITISTDLYTSNNNVYVHGTLSGFRSKRAEIFSEITPFTPDEIEEKEMINNYIDIQINKFFPNSLVNETNEIVYKIDNTHIDNSIILDNIINENYVIENNIIQVTELNLNDGESPLPLPPPNDYNNILSQILEAIKNIPQQIRDKFEDFSGGGSQPEPVEEGKGFWASLFDAISSIVASISDLLSSIPDMITSLLEGLLGLIEKIIELFIPTSEQLEELKSSFTALSDDFKLKFSSITDIGNSISSIYSSPKSLYDLTFTFKDEEVHVLPLFLQSQIATFRNVLSGGVLLATVIELYKRFVGREDIIK